MTDIVKQVRNGIHRFEHQTACGIIAVETLAVHREVLIELCDEIDRLRGAISDERAALEAELLKLKDGVAASSDYIQGRWDLIGEFQDVIRARGNT
jgi:ubiquinone biosynthesis protein UbiJ